MARKIIELIKMNLNYFAELYNLHIKFYLLRNRNKNHTKIYGHKIFITSNLKILFIT